jgi:hypothetical protein
MGLGWGPPMPRRLSAQGRQRRQDGGQKPQRWRGFCLARLCNSAKLAPCWSKKGLYLKRPRGVAARVTHRTWFSAWPSAICWSKRRIGGRARLLCAFDLLGVPSPLGPGKMRTLFLINERTNLPGKPS